MKIVTKNTLLNIINKNDKKINVILFEESWCEYCKKCIEILLKTEEYFSSETKNINFLRIDCSNSEDKDLYHQQDFYNISFSPTLIVTYDRIVVCREEMQFHDDRLIELLEKYIKLGGANYE